MTTANRIREMRSELGLSQADVALALGISPAAVAQWEIGKTRPSFKSLTRLQDLYGWSARWIDEGVGPKKTRRLDARPGFVPVIPLAAVPVVLADRTSSPATMATAWIPCPVNHGPLTFAYQVTDDAMTAPAGGKTYPPGCYVYVDPDRKDPAHDKPVLARLSSGETILANFMSQAGRIWLRLLNPAYPPIMEPFEVVGVVILKMEEP